VWFRNRDARSNLGQEIGGNWIPKPLRGDYVYRYIEFPKE